MPRTTPSARRTRSRSRIRGTAKRTKTAAAKSNGSIGISIPKLEAADKVTGRALYVDDLRIEGMLHGRTVRSTIARGRIRKIELDAAFDWSGFTIADSKDIPGENVVALIEDDQPLLAESEVRHFDEPILLLAHASAERAEAALRAVRIEYEELEPVLTVEDSIEKKALLYGDDNVFKHILIERGELDSGFAEAALVVEGEYRCGHQEQLYIENNGMIAERTKDGGLVVRGSLQCPYYVHKALLRTFALPPEKVRVIQSVTGGGFGGKEEYPSMIGGHAALLAWKSGRPVKIMYDRLEDIAATTKRHPAVIRCRTGVSAEGRLLAHDVDIVMDGGAYLTLSPVVLSRGAIHAGGPYRYDAVRIRARAVATNTPPNGAFRGFGAPQTQFAAECHMDRIAERLRIDPVALRRANHVVIDSVTPTGQILRESVSAGECLERTIRASEYRAKRARYERENSAAAAAEAAAARRAARPGASRRTDRAAPTTSRSNGLLVSPSSLAAPERRVRRGIGLSLVYHGAGFTGSGETKVAARVAMDLAPDGRPRVLAASTEIGQGTTTAFAQIAGSALRVPAEFVIIETPDTGLVPDSGPTVASRTVLIVGGLIERCAIGLREQLDAFAAREVTGAAEFRKVAKRWLEERGTLRVDRKYEKPPEIEWDDERYRGDAYPVFGYAALVAEVEVDLDTCETRVLKVTTAQDIGKAIHPVLAAGQVEGGTLQGLGWALLEEVRWQNGRVWNHQLTNYIIPTSADAPPIETILVEVPYSRGPHGAKGVGELPMDAPAPAIVEAIAHATGVRVAEIPVTPERLRRALEENGRS